MKRSLFFLAIGLCFPYVVFGQSASWKVRYKIFLAGNPCFDIQYTNEKEMLKEVTGYNVDHLGNETKIIGLKTDYKAGRKFVYNSYGSFTGIKSLYADVVQSTDKSKLYIHFWPIKNEKLIDQDSKECPNTDPKDTAAITFNKLVNKNVFYFNLRKREYLYLNSRAWHAGPLTTPFKVYLSSRDDTHTSNVTADVNAGFYIGQKWGKKSFVDMPAEKEGKTHEYFTSLNAIVGFSKLTIAANDNINKNANEGSVLGFSPGIGLGFHYDSFVLFLAGGIDVPISNSIANEWRYKNQPWLGFGLGFSIFK